MRQQFIYHQSTAEESASEDYFLGMRTRANKELSITEIRTIKSKKGVSWSCRNCNILSSDINDLKAAILSLRNDLAAREKSAGIDDEAFEELLAELGDRNNRKQNIIMFGVPESDTHDANTRRSRELETVQAVLKALPSGMNTDHIEEIVEPLRQEIANLKAQLSEAHRKLAIIAAQGVVQDTIEETVKTLESPDSHIDIGSNNAKPYKNEKFVDMKYSNIVPIHKGGSLKNGSGCVKMSERIKLKRTADSQRDAMTPTDLLNSDLPTTVAEHIMGDILRQCDLQNDKQAIDIEFRRLTSKLEHTRSQNSVLALTLSETKAHCDRLKDVTKKAFRNIIAGASVRTSRQILTRPDVDEVPGIQRGTVRVNREIEVVVGGMFAVTICQRTIQYQGGHSIECFCDELHLEFLYL
ncbi:hypothetical protein Trydic_g10061 [Trypoxylus dichotomus]